MAQPPVFQLHRPRLVALAALTAACAPHVSAQTSGATPTPAEPVVVTLPPQVILSRTPLSSTLTGFGDQPMARVPMQTTVLSRGQIDERQAQRLADVLGYEVAATDAYNSEGYWDYVALRGFVLDQRYNYRRDGLPISAETVIPLQNKERIEFLKGTSGIQAGTSSPGGLVNYAVKRPAAAPVRAGTLTAGERGTFGAAVDLGDRAGTDGQWGYRLNVARMDRRPEVERYSRSEQSLVALATEWQLTSSALLEVEGEWSRQSGRSVPAYSLTGDRLPTVRRPSNLNDQPWSQANRFDGLTGSVRLTHGVAPGWRAVHQVASQRLKTDDRLAFPFGFNCGAAGGFCDRYGPNGEFDLYDYRSEGERRRTHVAQSALLGQVDWGGVRHALHVGLQASRRVTETPSVLNNDVGTGNIDGSVEYEPNADPAAAGTYSRNRSREWFATDAIDWGNGLSTWLGLRHTRLDDPTSPSTLTPWLAASYEWAPGQHGYVSWGRGAESFLVPGEAGPVSYLNRGETLFAKTRQWELGTKGRSGATEWGLAYFDVRRPLPAAPAVDATEAVYAFDGVSHHSGLDGTVGQTVGAWEWRVGALLMKARRAEAADASINGRRPVNVPERTLKAQLRHYLAAVPGLDVQVRLVHEGPRPVVEDGSIALPSWTRTDLTSRYVHQVDRTRLTWTLGVINLFDRRAWKESPTQFGHVYLFPLEARAIKLSVEAEL